MVDGVLDGGSARTILLKLLFIWVQVGLVEFAFHHVDLLGHVGAEILLESLEVYVADIVGVQDVHHERLDLLFRRINLVLLNVPMEVVIAHESVSIRVKSAEGIEEARLAFKRPILDLSEQVS